MFRIDELLDGEVTEQDVLESFLLWRNEQHNQQHMQDVMVALGDGEALSLTQSQTVSDILFAISLL